MIDGEKAEQAASSLHFEPTDGARAVLAEPSADAVGVITMSAW